MIGIGINEDVFLKGASLDDKAVLEVVFDQKGAAAATSYFANVANDGAVVEDTSRSIRIFPSSGPKEGSMQTKEKQLEMIVSDINKTKGILLHLMSGYMTLEQRKGKIDPYSGTILTEANFDTEIFRKEVLEQVHRNMCTGFINATKDFFNKPEMLFRLLLLRQSADKPFATFRGRFLDENPMWEDMAIKKEVSKVKFTKWELDNKLDSSAPVEKAEKADNAMAAAPVTASSIFGTQ